MSESVVACPVCGAVPDDDELGDFEHPDDAWECQACGSTNTFSESFGEE